MHMNVDRVGLYGHQRIASIRMHNIQCNFYNLAKLWLGGGTKPVWGHGTPVPPFDDGPGTKTSVERHTLVYRPYFQWEGALQLIPNLIDLPVPLGI